MVQIAQPKSAQQSTPQPSEEQQQQFAPRWTEEHTRKLASTYKDNLRLRQDEEFVNELRNHAAYYNVPFYEGEFGLIDSIKQLAGGFFEGFTTLNIVDPPDNEYEAIIRNIGHLAGFAPGIMAGPAKALGATTWAKAAQQLNNYSIPMIGANYLTRKTKGIAKSVLQGSLGSRFSAADDAAKFMLGEKAKHIAEGAFHLGVASSISSVWDGVDGMMHSFFGGAIAGGVFRGIGNFLNAGDPKSQKFVQGLAGSLFQGLPATMRGATAPEQIYDYLLGAYFGGKEQPWFRAKAGKFIQEIDKQSRKNDALNIERDPALADGFRELPKIVRKEVRKQAKEIWGDPSENAERAHFFMKKYGILDNLSNEGDVVTKGYSVLSEYIRGQQKKTDKTPDDIFDIAISSGQGEGAKLIGRLLEKRGTPVVQYLAPGKKQGEAETNFRRSKISGIPRELSKAELYEAVGAVEKANRTLERVNLAETSDRNLELIYKNYWQVKKSSRIYAISEIETEGNLAMKGAKGKAIGWSVQMAIDVGKPVHLYDQVRKQWYGFDYGVNRFRPLAKTPRLVKRPGILGARKLTKAGEDAIRDLVEVSYGEKDPTTQKKGEKIKQGSRHPENAKKIYELDQKLSVLEQEKADYQTVFDEVKAGKVTLDTVRKKKYTKRVQEIEKEIDVLREEKGKLMELPEGTYMDTEGNLHTTADNDTGSVHIQDTISKKGTQFVNQHLEDLWNKEGSIYETKRESILTHASVVEQIFREYVEPGSKEPRVKELINKLEGTLGISLSKEAKQDSRRWLTTLNLSKDVQYLKMRVDGTIHPAQDFTKQGNQTLSGKKRIEKEPETILERMYWAEGGKDRKGSGTAKVVFDEITIKNKETGMPMDVGLDRFVETRKRDIGEKKAKAEFDYVMGRAIHQMYWKHNMVPFGGIGDKGRIIFVKLHPQAGKGTISDKMISMKVNKRGGRDFGLIREMEIAENKILKEKAKGTGKPPKKSKSKDHHYKARNKFIKLMKGRGVKNPGVLYDRMLYSNVMYDLSMNGFKNTVVNRRKIFGEGFVNNAVAFNKRAQIWLTGSFPGSRRFMMEYKDSQGENLGLVNNKFNYALIGDPTKPKGKTSLKSLNIELPEHVDGAIIVRDDVIDALNKDSGAKEISGQNKSFIIAPDSQHGALLGKYMMHTAGEKATAEMRRNNTHFLIMTSAAKQTGTREVGDYTVSRNGKLNLKAPLYQLKPEDIYYNHSVVNDRHMTQKQLLVKQFFTNIHEYAAGKIKKEVIDDLFESVVRENFTGTKEGNQLLDNYKEATTFKERDVAIQKILDNIMDINVKDLINLTKTPGAERLADRVYSKMMRFTEEHLRELAREGEITETERNEFLEELSDFNSATDRIMQITSIQRGKGKTSPSAFMHPFVRDFRMAVMSNWVEHRVTRPKMDNSMVARMRPYDKWLQADPKYREIMRNDEIFYLDKAYRDTKLTIAAPGEQGREEVVKLGELWDKYQSGQFDYTPKRKKYIEDTFEAIALRVPMDSLSGAHRLKFRGFTDRKGHGILLHSRTMRALGGADLDGDEAFVYFGGRMENGLGKGMKKSWKDAVYRNKEEFYSGGEKARSVSRKLKEIDSQIDSAIKERQSQATRRAATNVALKTIKVSQQGKNKTFKYAPDYNREQDFKDLVEYVDKHSEYWKSPKYGGGKLEPSDIADIPVRFKRAKDGHIIHDSIKFKGGKVEENYPEWFKRLDNYGKDVAKKRAKFKRTKKLSDRPDRDIVFDNYRYLVRKWGQGFLEREAKKRGIKSKRVKYTAKSGKKGYNVIEPWRVLREMIKTGHKKAQGLSEKDYTTLPTVSWAHLRKVLKIKSKSPKQIDRAIKAILTRAKGREHIEFVNKFTDGVPMFEKDVEDFLARYESPREVASFIKTKKGVVKLLNKEDNMTFDLLPSEKKFFIDKISKLHGNSKVRRSLEEDLIKKVLVRVEGDRQFRKGHKKSRRAKVTMTLPEKRKQLLKERRAIDNRIKKLKQQENDLKKERRKTERLRDPLPRDVADNKDALIEWAPDKKWEGLTFREMLAKGGKSNPLKESKSLYYSPMARMDAALGAAQGRNMLGTAVSSGQALKSAWNAVLGSGRKTSDFTITVFEKDPNNPKKKKKVKYKVIIKPRTSEKEKKYQRELTRAQIAFGSDPLDESGLKDADFFFRELHKAYFQTHILRVKKNKLEKQTKLNVNNIKKFHLSGGVVGDFVNMNRAWFGRNYKENRQFSFDEKRALSDPILDLTENQRNTMLPKMADLLVQVDYTDNVFKRLDLNNIPIMYENYNKMIKDYDWLRDLMGRSSLNVKYNKYVKNIVDSKIFDYNKRVEVSRHYPTFQKVLRGTNYGTMILSAKGRKKYGPTAKNGQRERLSLLDKLVRNSEDFILNDIMDIATMQNIIKLSKAKHMKRDRIKMILDEVEKIKKENILQYRQRRNQGRRAFSTLKEGQQKTIYQEILDRINKMNSARFQKVGQKGLEELDEQSAMMDIQLLDTRMNNFKKGAKLSKFERKLFDHFMLGTVHRGRLEKAQKWMDKLYKTGKVDPVMSDLISHYLRQSARTSKMRLGFNSQSVSNKAITEHLSEMNKLFSKVWRPPTPKDVKKKVEEVDTNDFEVETLDGAKEKGYFGTDYEIDRAVEVAMGTEPGFKGIKKQKGVKLDKESKDEIVELVTHLKGLGEKIQGDLNAYLGGILEAAGAPRAKSLNAFNKQDYKLVNRWFREVKAGTIWQRIWGDTSPELKKRYYAMFPESIGREMMKYDIDFIKKRGFMATKQSGAEEATIFKPTTPIEKMMHLTHNLNGMATAKGEELIAENNKNFHYLTTFKEGEPLRKIAVTQMELGMLNNIERNPFISDGQKKYEKALYVRRNKEIEREHNWKDLQNRKFTVANDKGERVRVTGLEIIEGSEANNLTGVKTKYANLWKKMHGLIAGKGIDFLQDMKWIIGWYRQGQPKIAYEKMIKDVRKMLRNNDEKGLQELMESVGIDGMRHIARSMMIEQIPERFKDQRKKFENLIIKNTNKIDFNHYWPHMFFSRGKAMKGLEDAAKNLMNDTKLSEAEIKADMHKLHHRVKSLTGDWEFQDMQDWDRLDNLFYRESMAELGKIKKEKAKGGEKIKWYEANQRMGSMMERTGHIDGWSIEPNVVNAYIKNLSNTYHRQMVQILNRQIIHEAKKPMDRKFGFELSKKWQNFMKLYAQDAMGNPSVIPDALYNDPGMKLKGTPYAWWADNRVLDRVNNISKKLGIGKELPEGLKKFGYMDIRAWSNLEAKFELASLLAHPKTAVTNIFGGSLHTIINAGPSYFFKARNINELRKINPEWKTMEDVRRFVIKSGVLPEFLVHELGLQKGFSDVNTQKFLTELASKFQSKDKWDRADVKDIGKKYGVGDSIIDTAAKFMSIPENTLRRDAFMSHYLRAWERFGGAIKDPNHPFLIEQAKKGVKATQFLYNAPNRPAFSRTALGKVMTRFHLFAWNSTKLRNTIVREAKRMGFQGEQGKRFGRMMTADMMVIALGNMFMYSLFDNALPPPWNWAQDTADWLFGDERTRNRAFFGQLPSTIAPLQVVTPPIARLPISAWRQWVDDDYSKFSDYYIWTLFPYGRLARDIAQPGKGIIDNPTMIPEKFTGMPLRKMGQYASQRTKEKTEGSRQSSKKPFREGGY